MIIKTINDIVDFKELMFILIVFEIYLCMHIMNLSTILISQRAMTVEKAMIKIRKFEAKNRSSMRWILETTRTWIQFTIYLSILTY